MFIFFFIILLLMPVSLIIFGGIWGKHPPKEINSTSGYRTNMSMKNQYTWRFAHKYVSKIWVVLGIVMAFVSILFLIIFGRSNQSSLIVVVSIAVPSQIVSTCLTIIPTERALHKNFDKDGNPRP